MARSGWRDRERRHELVRVVGCGGLPRLSLRRRDEAAQRPIGGGRVGHQHQLVRGVKRDQVTDGPPQTEQVAKPAIRADPFDEVIATLSVAQPALFLNRQRCKPREQFRCEQAGPVSDRLMLRSVRTVNGDTGDATARRIALQHIAAQVFFFEFRDAALRERHHG